MIRYISYIVTSIVAVSVWYVVSLRLGVLLVPNPVSVFSLLLTEAGSAEYWAHVEASSWRIVAGMGLAFVLAVPFGLFVGSNPMINKIVSPVINMSYPVPKIVLLPIILLLFGIGDVSKIILIMLIIFFQVFITSRDAARNINEQMILSFRSLGGNKLQYYWHIVLPASLPGIFTSMRLAAGTAVAVLFFVESISATHGLGLYIIDAWGRADYTSMYVGIVSMSLLGILLYEFFEILERKTCKWKHTQ